MHELSVLAALARQVEPRIPPGTQVTEVRIEVGELEHLDQQLMQSLWPTLVDGTPCAGSQLVVHRVPVEVRCGVCRHQFVPEDHLRLVCPACGRTRPELVRGSGVWLRSLEVEELAGTAAANEGDA